MVEHFEGGTENTESIACGESRQSAMEAATKINGGESDLRRVLDTIPALKEVADLIMLAVESLGKSAKPTHAPA